MNARVRTHPDVATFGNGLQRAALVQQVARGVATGQPPLVFGVHGDWGSGKTSFLCQLEHELTGLCSLCPEAEPDARQCKDVDHVFTVWFEAWRYQNEAAPVVALLHEISRQLPRYAQIKEVLKKWGPVLAKGILGTFAEASADIEAKPLGTGGKVSVKFKNPMEAMREDAKAWDETHFGAPLTSNRIRELLTEAIKKLLDGDDRRVCIIIDDLDRCDPAAALRLLEGIKIHLSLPQCVFVLGVNARQIERAIAPFLPGANEKDTDTERQAEAAEYLEKLCTFTWKLPFLAPAARVDLLKLWLQDPTPAHPDDTALPIQLRYRIETVAKAHDCLPANPRKIKALANTIRQLAAHGWGDTPLTSTKELAVPDTEAEHLLVAASIYHFYPELLRYLQTSPSAWIEFVNWARGVPSLPAESDFAKVLKNLRSPTAADARTEAQSATPGGATRVNAFADPVHLNVFRIQGLLLAATAPSGGNSVTADSLRRYLDLPA